MMNKILCPRGYTINLAHFIRPPLIYEILCVSLYTLSETLEVHSLAFLL